MYSCLRFIHLSDGLSVWFHRNLYWAFQIELVKNDVVLHFEMSLLRILSFLWLVHTSKGSSSFVTFSAPSWLLLPQ